MKLNKTKLQKLNKKVLVKVSSEVLWHFRCGDCNKWWTIGDAPKSKKSWFCPWCGKECKIQKSKIKMID